MKVFWMTLIFTFVLGYLSRYTGRKTVVNGEIEYRANKGFYIIAVIILILVAGLRSGIGDTVTYRQLFDNTVPDIMYYIKQFGTLKETGFWLSMAAIKQYISTESQVFIFIYALITISLISIPFYKYSRVQELSFFLFITMGGYLVVMNGMRQYLAAAIVFCAFPWIQEKMVLLFPDSFVCRNYPFICHGFNNFLFCCKQKSMGKNNYANIIFRCRVIFDIFNYRTNSG